MSSKSSEIQNLQSLSEEDFRQEVLIPLLRKMNFQKVRERHGPDEYGKDITFFEPAEFGGTRYAIVAKVGSISGAASGKSNLEIVKNQIRQAFSMPYFDLEDKRSYSIDKVIVWTTGNISRNAQEQIKELSDQHFKYVDFRDGSGTIDLLNKYYPTYFTIKDPILSEYFDAVKKHYCRLEELRTLGTSDNEKRLPVIFIPLFFTEFASRKMENGKKRIYSIDEITKDQNSFIILGEAGAGKSTLLRRMLIGMVETNEKNASKYPIPILARMRSIEFGLDNPIEHALQTEFNRFNSQDSTLDINDELIKGNIVVFLDGLDELETQSNIDLAMSCIKTFSEIYPKIKVVLASRILGTLETSDILPKFRMLKIQDLSPEQMVSFVEKWYGGNTVTSQKLIKLIHSPESLRGLPATPLTLALVAILQEHNKWSEIPANQTELFSKYIELALGRWDASKDISVQFEYPVKKYILQQISWDIHQNVKTSISPTEFDVWIRLLADEYGLTIDLETFRKEVIERSELVFLNDHGEYEFKHKSFQDFFVGLEINHQKDPINLIVSNFLDPWWSGAIFFAGGLKPDHQEYIEAIIMISKLQPEASMFYAVNLGELLQATYMSTVHVKKIAINKVVDEIINSWDYSTNKYIEMPDKPKFPKNVPPHIMLLAIHTGVAKLALGSVTLSKPLSELAQEAIENLKRNNTSDRDKTINEWKAFFLAMACSECEQSIPDFIKIYESGKINDPGFIFFGKAVALLISQNKWINETLQSKAGELAKKLDRKFKKIANEYRNLLNREKVLLLPPRT
jgi:hypothetical protein